AIRQRPSQQDARLVQPAFRDHPRVVREPAGDLPQRHRGHLPISEPKPKRVTEHNAASEPDRCAEPVALAVAATYAGSDAEPGPVPVHQAIALGTGKEMLEIADSPFMSSVERRRPGGSMRAYVTRTLPQHSAVVVSNRAPHEPRPEGG